METWIVIWRDGGAIESVEVWENTEIAAEACYQHVISILSDKFGLDAKDNAMERLFPTLNEMNDPSDAEYVRVDGLRSRRADALSDIVWVEKGKVRNR